jgi:hypothetical protein
MDGERFDAMTRLVAARLSRRGALRALAGGLVGSVAALVGGDAGAERCLGDGEVCPTTRRLACCSGSCCQGACCPTGTDCTDGTCCPSLQACGETCCPPENVGCTQNVLPDGTTFVGCLCAGGAVWDRAQNACVCATTCEIDEQCCSGHCCNGICCPNGEVCAADGRCVDPKCCSGSLICGRLSTEDFCCAHPQVDFCCCETESGAAFVGCCSLGVNCIGDPEFEAYLDQIGCVPRRTAIYHASNYGHGTDGLGGGVTCSGGASDDVKVACQG